MKLTEKIVKELQPVYKRNEARTKYMERLDGKLLGFYVTFGAYDNIGIADAPHDEVAIRLLLGLGSACNVRTTTRKPFTKEQYAEIIKINVIQHRND